MTESVKERPATAAQPSGAPYTMSDLIVDYLELMGVEYVFGIPGVHIMGLYEALTRSAARGGPRAVITRHESGGSFMAAGYARETGRLGVCCATAGPGTTNAMTGLMSAQSDHLPVLAITGQGMLPAFGMGYVQESSPYEAIFPDIIDTTGMMAHCAHYNSIVTHRMQLEGKVAAAITAALSPTLRGVAHLSIPPDILDAPAKPGQLMFPNLRQLLDVPSSFMEEAAVDKLWRELTHVLEQQGRILLHVGYECRGAGEEIQALAEVLNAEIITSVQGRAFVNPEHPLLRGIYGPLWAHPSAHETVVKAPIDLLLSLGTSVSAADTGAWSPAMLQNLVHIHPSEVYFLRSTMAKLQVRGTVKRVLRELLNRLQAAPHLIALRSSLNGHQTANIGRVTPDKMNSDVVPVKPQRVVKTLWEKFPPETRYVADIGNALIWTAHYMLRQQPENYHVMFAQSSMGSGPGTAIGLAMGARGTPVVCAIGDGAMLMCGNELTVAVQEKLPVIFVIFNDGQLGMVRNRHAQTGQQPVDVHVPPVDFKLLAEAMGAQGFTISEPSQFDELDYAAICSRPGPTVLNVLINPDEKLRDGM